VGRWLDAILGVEVVEGRLVMCHFICCMLFVREQRILLLIFHSVGLIKPPFTYMLLYSCLRSCGLEDNVSCGVPSSLNKNIS
jgi:hypothetical protein